VITDKFLDFGRTKAAALGLADLPLVAIPHPISGRLPDEVARIAAEAMLDPAFNLPAVQSTTNPVAPLLIVNGPIAKRLGINGAENCFGQGALANATIGRAVRFILLNIGGAVPGVLDRSTHGQPGKFSSCIAENEAASPWAPLHVARGFQAEQSVVTVAACDPFVSINDTGSNTGEEVLASLAEGMALPGTANALRGGSPLVALAPEHVALIHRDGFTRADVQRTLYTRARIALDRFPPANRARIRHTRKEWMAREGSDAYVVPAEEAASIVVFVAGGAGKHSLFIPTFGNSRPVSRAIDG
jgi:hypothetical protein